MTIQCVYVKCDGNVGEGEKHRFGKTWKEHDEIDSMTKHILNDDPKAMGFLKNFTLDEAVKLCEGDPVMTAQLRDRKNNHSNPDEHIYGACPVADKIGFPLVIGRMVGKIEWSKAKKAYVKLMMPKEFEQNSPGLSLLVNCNPDSSKFGVVPEGWRGDAGDLVVARQDKRDLLPEHIELLANICLKIQNSLGAAGIQNWAEQKGEKGRGRVRETVDAIASPQAYKSAWRTYCLKKAEIDVEDFDLPSPFEIEDGMAKTISNRKISRFASLALRDEENK